MTRKIRRTHDYEITLILKNDQFIRTPRDLQRNWMLNRALKEAGEDLDALHILSQQFVTGDEPADISERGNTHVDDDDIMEAWQEPVMRAMAEQVCRSQGDVLEIGFGRGVASQFIQDCGVRSHTVVECNDGIIDRFFEPWRATLPDRKIRLLRGKWQDTTSQLDLYDGVFFHTYPLNENEFVEYVAQSSTFAEHFFDTAAAHLRKGGIFSYLTNEMDSLSRSHQRALLKRFSAFRTSLLTGLNIPEDTRDAQWLNQTVLVSAEK